MPDIDSLSIRLTSSSSEANRAIQSVIDKLALLNGALNNYTDDSKFVKGMNSLVGGLSGISKAVNSIDLEKLKNLSSVLNTLGNSGEKLAKLNFIQTFSEMGSELQKVNSAATNTAKKVMEMYNMPGSYKSKLTDAFKDLYASAGNDNAFDKAAESIRVMVTEAQKAKPILSEAYKNVRGYINHSLINIPKEVMKGWGEDAISNRATISNKNTTTQVGVGTPFETAAKEMKEAYGATIDLDNGIQAMANSLVQFLNDEKQFATVHTDFEGLSDTFGQIYNSINGITAATTQMNAAVEKSDEEFYEMSSGAADFVEIQEQSERAAQSITNVKATVEAVKAEMRTEIGNPFEGLINGVEALNGVEVPAEKFAGIQTLASGISKLGGVNAQRAAVTIPQLTIALTRMMNELAKAPKISNDVVRLAEALAKFSRQGKSAAASATGVSKSSHLLKNAFSSLYGSTHRTHRSFTSLAAVFGSLYANFFLLIRAARLLGKAMDYSSSMTEAQNVVAVTFGKQADVMDNFAQTAIKDFGMARLSATEFASRFQAMGKTIGITAEQIVAANTFIESKISGNKRAYKELGDSVADMSINLTKLTADMASLYNQDYADVAADMQAIYTGMTRPLRKYGLDLTQATLKEWAMANGLEYDIEKMTQAEKTMLRYQYVMSRTGGAMGDFAKTADTWANSMRTVKQLLQEIARTIGEALINALRPALIAFRNFLFNFLNAIESALNALGKLLGWKKFNFGGAALVEDTEDWADALDDAGDAAKKLKGQLRGIDELNNLTTNNKGGGGAGGGGLLGAGDEDFWEEIEEEPEEYESAIQSFYELGRKISEAIKNGLESIDWDTIFASLTTFGTNLASFLNGLIDPETLKVIGETIGNGVMAGVTLALSFAEEFDFENLGEAIAAGINGFFEKFSGADLANTINTWIDGLETTLKEAAKDIHWDEIFTDLFGFFNEIELDSIGFVLAANATILGVPAIATALGKEIIKHPIALGTIIIASIGGFKFGNWINDQWEEALGESYENFWFDFFDAINDFYTADIPFESLFNAINLDNVIQNLQLATSSADGFFEVLSQADGQSIMGYDKPLESLADKIKKATENLKEYRKQQDYLKSLKLDKPKSWGQLFFEELGNKDNLTTKEDYVDFYFGWLEDLWPTVQPKLEKFGQDWEDFWFTVFDFWNTDNGGPLEALGVFDWLDNLTEDLLPKFEEFKQWHEEFWFTVFDFWKDPIKAVTGKSITEIGEDIVKGIMDGITDESGNLSFQALFDSIINGIKSIFGIASPAKEMNPIGEFIVQGIIEGFGLVDFYAEMNAWFEENVKPWFTLDTWKGIFVGIKDALKEIWDETVGVWVTDIGNFFKENVEPFFTKDNWLTLLSGVKDAFESIWGDSKQFAKDFFNSVATFAEKFINGVIDGFGTLVKAKGVLEDKNYDFNFAHIQIPRFANGGFPQVGTLFLAGEMGSEMVGNINGKTGVVSNGEITGIASAIRSTSDVEIELLRQQNVLLQGILEKEFGISNDTLFKSVRSSAREFTNSTGKPAFS